VGRTAITNSIRQNTAKVYIVRPGLSCPTIFCSKMASIVRDCNPRCCNIYGCTHIDMFHNQFLSRNCFSKNLNLDGEETIHHAHHTHSLTTTRGIGRLKVHAHSSRSILMVSSELQDDQDLRIFMISATCQKRGSFFNLGCRSCRSFIQ
jgi:hypothetical protein